jgi:hypothetical protein
MKKLLTILLCLPLLFNSCKNEEETNLNSPYIGYWSGKYYEGDSTTQIGIWDGNISSSGKINGSVLSAETGTVFLNGIVTNSGVFNAEIEEGDYVFTFDGQLNGTYGSGGWSSSIDNASGFWEGNNYNQ